MLSKWRNIIALSLLLIPSIMNADKIAVFNKIFQPKEDIYVAVYFYKKQEKVIRWYPYKTESIYTIVRQSNPKKIPNNSSKTSLRNYSTHIRYALRMVWYNTKTNDINTTGKILPSPLPFLFFIIYS